MKYTLNDMKKMRDALIFGIEDAAVLDDVLSKVTWMIDHITSLEAANTTMAEGLRVFTQNPETDQGIQGEINEVYGE